jgi:5-methyltetrahydropteroyltriglutamate--homocysteine methyltransferase
MASLLEEALEAVGPSRLWVNPDCGLKTRDYPEVLASLRNMVAAARTVRGTMARSRPPADDR